MYRSLLAVLLVFIAVSHAAVQINSAIRNTRVDRTIDATSNIVRITADIEVSNSGSAAVSKYLVSIPGDRLKNLAYIGATQGESDLDWQFVTPEDARTGVKYVQFKLAHQINANANTKLQLSAVFTHVMEPFPKEIEQRESQLVLLRSTLYFFSPYVTEEQTTTVKMPSAVVKSKTEVSPVSVRGQELEYGPYSNVAAYSGDELKVHFENNSPFVTFTSLTREIEISHWRGQVSVEETVEAVHDGAKLKGVFSRLEYQRMQMGVASVRALHAILPVNAEDAYFRDEIGNISSSNFRVEEEHADLELRLRFPLFGGWTTAFYYGYNLPLEDVLSHGADGYVLDTTFGSHLENALVNQMTVRIILPEGATNPRVEVPFDVERSYDVYYSYLDVSGRTVVVLTRSNVVDEIGDQHVKVTYDYSTIALLTKPVRVIGFVFVLFVAVMVAVRVDLRITPSKPHQS